MAGAMAQLPVGTVTFLFTDVEGSTQLLLELGPAAYADALAEHRRLLRKAFLANGGIEVDTQGDAFFVAFADPGSAAAAARAAQSALEGGSIRVRMGLHTGEPLLVAEGYVGIDVHKAARICAAGHGGQVVVSEATSALLPATALRPLGPHRLKDLSEAELLYQLGEGDFPPLKSLHQTNLPVQPTRFLGRERELAEVLSVLSRDDVRLLTLTGAGGSGKTRLALQAAAEVVDEFPHGVWWVALQALRDPQLVTTTIAATLGATGDLAEHLAERRLLLLLDNLEHLLDSGPALAELMAACPGLRLLVTSRERLRVQGEHEYEVLPFVPEEAVGFFLARAPAGRVSPDDREAVPEICRRLDNLPLALELAAARLKAISPGQLLERLGERLPVLTGGPRDAPERQRTLRATIEWSHDLLTADEQRLFSRLAVFAGGWTLQAAEQVAGADLDGLQSLVDKSLVRFEGERYTMLETIREYAAERLAESGEEDDLERRHADFFVRLGESAGLFVEAEERERYDLVVPEQDNIRAVLDWALDHDPELGIGFAVTLEQFWIAQSPFEGARRLEALLDSAVTLPGDLRARALRTLGGVTFIVGRFEEGTRIHEESLAEYRRLGNERGIAILLERLAQRELLDGDLERARVLAEESRMLSERAGFARGKAVATTMLGDIAYATGEHEPGLEMIERGAALAGDAGLAWFQMASLLGLAERLQELGRHHDAARWARRALALGHRIGERQFTVYSLAILSRAAAHSGDEDLAGRLWGALEREEERGPIGQWERAGERDAYAAAVLGRTGAEFERARREGRLLSLDAAIELALAASGPAPDRVGA
jgi:predicted ATPase/class 3 adenylate cyclase